LFAPALLAVGACAHQAPAPVACSTAPPSPVVARIADETITLGDVDATILHELYELRSGALSKMVDQRVLDGAAKRAGKSADDLIADLTAARVPAISNDEAQAFYEANQGHLQERLAGKSFIELKPILIRALQDQKRVEAVSAVMEELREKEGVQITLEEPTVAVAATGPARGPAEAPVTIVVFSDFQCPYCAKGRDVMEHVLSAYAKEVRLVYRDFPLPFHPQAEKAAEAGRCANEQQQFWRIHDWMFNNQQNLSVESLKDAAKSLGFDEARFNECLDSGKYRDAVAEDTRAGEKAGVHGTPGYFVNGHMINGAMPFERFKAEIDGALKVAEQSRAK
jgi:protein-disulfide isomerase